MALLNKHEKSLQVCIYYFSVYIPLPVTVFIISYFPWITHEEIKKKERKKGTMRKTQQKQQMAEGDVQTEVTTKQQKVD